MPLYMIVKAMTFAAVVLFATTTAASIVAEWNAAALAEVRLSTSPRNGPPIVARALAIAHTCMYDAWAQYDAQAVATTVLRGSLRQPANERNDTNKAKAISFAAYRCLVNLFPAGAGRLAAVPFNSGYDYTNLSTDTTTPVGIGNVAAAAVIAVRHHDGANQYGDEPNSTGALYSDWALTPAGLYTPLNQPLAFCTPLMPTCAPLDIDAPDNWQPLIGPPLPDGSSPLPQKFVGPHWERVTPFAISATQFDSIVVVPPPDVFKNDGRYKQNVNDILDYSKTLNAARKLIVEYWADGPASELPPGHWGVFAQFVSQRDHNTIDQDLKMFFAMHNASFDAGIVAWHFKRMYDGVRPITAIRYLMQGEIVRAWGGPGRPTENIPGEKWMPYNPGNNLTPPFPGFFSGHSTFSSASAKVLQLFTGSDTFGFSTVIPPNFGRVEPGIPDVPTTISFATFSEAAQQAGLSRLYGGIHFPDDNTSGQAVGALIGEQAWAKAQTYFNGTAP